MGREVSLHIYDRQEIAGGRSCYQIARQPHFSTKSKMLPARRGDVALLINGMPLIHIELKRSGVSVSQARDRFASTLTKACSPGCSRSYRCSWL